MIEISKKPKRKIPNFKTRIKANSLEWQNDSRVMKTTPIKCHDRIPQNWRFQMIDRLTTEQEQLHNRALNLSHRHRRMESMIIEVLKEIDRTKLYRPLGHASLFQYAVQSLGFSESVAYCFISVSRKSAEVSVLNSAIQAQTLSVCKASRLVSILTAENAIELIEFAKNHSAREIDFEVAKRNPKARTREKIRALSADLVEIKLCVSKATLEK